MRAPVDATRRRAAGRDLGIAARRGVRGAGMVNEKMSAGGVGARALWSTPVNIATNMIGARAAPRVELARAPPLPPSARRARRATVMTHTVSDFLIDRLT